MKAATVIRHARRRLTEEERAKTPRQRRAERKVALDKINVAFKKAFRLNPKSLTLVIRTNTAITSLIGTFPVIAEHRATKSRGYGATIEAAVHDLFTCAGAAGAAARCEFPIDAKARVAK